MQIRWKSADKKTIQNFTGMVAFIDLSFGSSTKSGIHVVEYVKGKAKTKNSLKLNSSSELTFGKLPGHVRGLFEAHSDAEWMLVLEGPLFREYDETGNPVARGVDRIDGLAGSGNTCMSWHMDPGLRMNVAAGTFLNRLVRIMKKSSITGSKTVTIAEGFVSFKGDSETNDRRSMVLQSITDCLSDIHKVDLSKMPDLRDAFLLRAIFEQTEITISSQSHLVGEIIEPEKTKGHTYEYVVKGLSHPPAVLRYDPSPWLILRNAA